MLTQIVLVAAIFLVRPIAVVVPTDLHSRAQVEGD